MQCKISSQKALQRVAHLGIQFRGQNKNHYIVCMLLFVVQTGLLDKIMLEFLVSNFSQLLLINENTLHNKFGELLLFNTY